MVKILDTTLREGQQTAEENFTLMHKKEIARALDDFGVEYIEAGMPVISESEKMKVTAITRLGLNAEIVGLARARRADIDAVAESGCGWIGIFCGINELSSRHKLWGRSLNEGQLIIRKSIEYAKNRGLKVRF